MFKSGRVFTLLSIKTRIETMITAKGGMSYLRVFTLLSIKTRIETEANVVPSK